ncbi:hypothetical protein ANN_11246 [Periplaneta americana]|uniref:Uncharacterized protein n=1 Tax=Periplaneta americana TaxID=6978 RepID=A0ABQ8T5X4_PERAM|nr:hypothetical protein ANN_11246 [Periplaneta americana]
MGKEHGHYDEMKRNELKHLECGCGEERIPTRDTILRWVASFRITDSTLKKKSPGRNSIALKLYEARRVVAYIAYVVYKRSSEWYNVTFLEQRVSPANRDYKEWTLRFGTFDVAGPISMAFKPARASDSAFSLELALTSHQLAVDTAEI